ncbi:MAG: HlyD family type I secretion periplasmic adaptor subunit [Pseudomonadota bacterium]|nr:HlyD family type I secretion periplasmic adaptor subunit [Pseudomonadota bacterium]MEC9235888.1 HlyD family type I secretion periplasmic adaptor subunit [Pseudomonadota bacterium]MED5422911.1 HlyD family type I secretion periplasmic adaptor subunit [Pseudomonadota bacterium]
MSKQNVEHKDQADKDELALSVNDQGDWNKIQANWAKQQADLARAKAEKFFTSDEELPLSRHLLLVFIVGFFLAFIIWANFATLDEVTRGDGKIIPSSEIQVIQNLEGGIVDEFLVKEGEMVSAGQVLLRLRDVSASSDYGANKARYYGLLATTARLQAEAENSDLLTFSDEVKQNAPTNAEEEMESFLASRRQIKQQISVLEQQLAQRKQEVQELKTRENDLRRVLDLSREEKAMIEPLVARGSAPRIELVQLERGIQEKVTELNGVLQSMPRAELAVKEVEARISEIVETARSDAQQRLSETTIEMNSIKQTLAALEDRKVRTEIKSPVNGVVKDLKINTVGGVVQPGSDILEIVPHDDQLLVEARIRPSDIAFLHPGQKAVVKITAYDFSIYGGLEAELIDISADTITDEQGESFYRVRIRTFDTELTRKNEVLPIIPGMVTSVDILTGKKTVMDYILKPFIKTLKQSLNER